MATKLSSITRTAYKSMAGDIEMNYSIEQNEGEAVRTVSATLRRGDERLGSITKVVGNTLNLLLSDTAHSEAPQLLSTFLSDVEQICNELNATKQ